MPDAYSPLPLPIFSRLPDGTRVRVEPVRVPDLGFGGMLSPYVEMWQVLPDAPMSDDSWAMPLGWDFTPDLALEEAWYDTLVRRRAHLDKKGLGMPLRPRFLALQQVQESGARFLQRAAWSATYESLAAAITGYDSQCAQFLAEHGYTGFFMLLDRKTQRCLATSTPGHELKAGPDPLGERWVVPRRGAFTGSQADDTPPPERANAGFSGEQDGLVAAVPADEQTDLDAVVACAHGGPEASDARDRLFDYLERESELVGSGDLRDSETALPPWTLPHWDDIQGVDDEDVREQFGIPAEAPVGEDERLRYFGEVTLQQLYEDADLTPSLGAIWLTARDGRQAVLVHGITGYSFSGLDYHRFGPYRTWHHFVAWLDMTGWIRDTDAWRALDPGDQRRYFARIDEGLTS